MKDLKRQILNYIKKDPYDDWIEHMIKFIMPTIMIIGMFMLIYCILGIIFGWTPPQI